MVDVLNHDSVLSNEFGERVNGRQCHPAAVGSRDDSASQVLDSFKLVRGKASICYRVDDVKEASQGIYKTTNEGLESDISVSDCSSDAGCGNGFCSTVSEGSSHSDFF